METTTIKIKGMTCGACVAAVGRVLHAMHGVEKVDVSLERGEASIEFDRAEVAEEDLRAAIEEAGYDVLA
jgi:copper chaperone